jgi:hypothetical protein
VPFAYDDPDEDTATGENSSGTSNPEDTAAAPRPGRCQSQFTVRYANGASSTFDGCAAWDLEAAYEFDPDVPPEISAATLRFDAWDEPSFVCEVRLQLGYLCAAGTYPLSAQTGVTWSTHDCPDTPEFHEGTHAGTTGYVDVWAVDNGRQAGNLEGEVLQTRLRGAMRAVSEDGTVVEGTFDVERELVAQARPSDATCERVVGDADRDQAVTDALGGLDCNDADPWVGTSDVDGDGYSVCGGDCDDTDATVRPGDTCEYVSVEGGLTIDGYPGLTLDWSFVDPATTPCPGCGFALRGSVGTAPMVHVAYDPSVRATYLWTYDASFTAPGTLIPFGIHDRFTFSMPDVTGWGPVHGDFRLSYR